MADALGKETLIEKGCLYAETAKEAYDRYCSFTVSAADEEMMRHFMKQIYEENRGQMYADFYYEALTEEEQRRFVSGLCEEEKHLLKRFCVNGEEKHTQIYYQVNREELEFLFEITAREWLFSSFYGANKKVLVWGNYDLTFPVFCENEETLEKYKNLAKECGLESYI